MAVGKIEEGRTKAENLAKEQETKQLALEKEEKDKVTQEKMQADQRAVENIKRRQNLARGYQPRPAARPSLLGGPLGETGQKKTLLGQ